MKRVNDSLEYNPFLIGEKIGELRSKKKVSQITAAEMLDVSSVHYARIESGSRGMSLQLLFRIMEYYDTDANTILGISPKGA